MASSITRTPFLRAASIRGYAAQAKLNPISGTINYEVTTTTLPNKLVVSSSENESPIARISVLFKAGSRNETPDNAGVAHVLRSVAGLSCKNATQFSITRHVQQVGASLTATSDRESIAYTLEGTRDAIEQTLPFLTEVTTQQAFKPWEVDDNLPRLRLDLALRPPQLRAVDLLHKAAYHSRGLGNSLFIAKHQIGKISPETLQHYVASNYTTGRAAVVGLGVDHSQLVKYAQCLKLESGEGSFVSSKYKGGEIRSDKGGALAYVAIAAEGAGWNSGKELTALEVLKYALGVGPVTKWGSDNSGILKKTIGEGHGVPVAVSAFNFYYSDSGMFGALIVAPANSAGAVVQKVANVLRNGKVTDADIGRAKNQLKLAALTKMEGGGSAIEEMGQQALHLGSVMNPADIISAVDAVPNRDVLAAAARVASGKLSISSYGDLRTVPFLDELK